ncbi:MULTISPECIES: TonB-dependent receptor plug domain-containing protein [Sphingobium]|uniref:TonB-dependent receptor n=1 Tax=Sphingobium chungbukense TaxID=56193 RepID=A0A0M3AUH5_9SPHN|nr:MULTISPECIES: TonB-dependent receptor [Sphingobium]KKW92199.1 TonB-dependent receptor [Sphingobium chungbukense]PJG48947.1 TonB-dependent receptor [Sphingobium sp. LB126]
MKKRFAGLRHGAAMSAFAIAATGIAPALAQSSPQTATAPDEGATIVVTGSLLSRANAETPSPVSVITSETLTRAGVTNMADAIRQASADGAGSIGIGFTSGFSAGGSAVSLRNLGVSSTLVLVDGLRSANFPLSDDGHNSYVDLASIPQVNVERVEVLKDGASSTYGADAIGGVVNIITRKQFTGLEGGAESGISQEGDGQKYRLRLLAGYGDYDSQGWNVYIGGEYEKGGKVTANSRGFPFNTLDLRAIGGVDNNRADDTLGTATTNAVVTRVTQTDLNNPLAGSVANATTPALFTSLTPLGNCPFGTYSENTGTRVGTACAHDLTREYIQILPKQERYAGVARFSFRLSDDIEGYVAGSYSHNKVDITLIPRAIRQNQAFGGSPSTSTQNPGIVLPVWICPSGVNCADPATPGRTLNPNNPYAAAFANNPAAGAARIYYLFGDVKAGSVRTNELYRITSGLNGTFGDSWKWNLEAGYSRDDLKLIQQGWANVAGLTQAINTGSYNFVNPSLNSQAVRDSVLPPITSLSNSSEFTVDASLSRKLFTLPGGDLQIAVGGQYRKEKLTNRSANPNLDVPGLSTAQAYGNRDVWAGYFEIDAPILDSLEVNASGRYDHYSEGFSHFSPKFGAKFTPIKQISFRGTYSKGFRAPTFAEIDPRSSYSGFVGFNPSTSPDAVAFRQAHAANAAYIANYSLGRGYVGNPDIKPEKSRSFTLGVVFEPTRNISFTADYFNVKKTDLIVTGPLTGNAIRAYYSVAGQTFASADAASAAGCAAVAAVAAGYSCNVIDGADPFALNALPRLLVVNAPYVNANFDVTTGLQFGANAQFDISDNVQFQSRLDLQATLKFNRHLDDGKVQRFVGTVGPADLSSGGGTPKWRGNWQNTLTVGKVSLTATTYYVGSMKGVATDQGNLDTSCAATIYKDGSGGNSFCKIKTFVYADLNATVEVNENFSFFGFIGNFTNAGAPLYANTLYTSQPNYLASWHLPGLIGRTYRVGANFKF